jgi:membrane associated rhomboid family serine protease
MEPIGVVGLLLIFLIFLVSFNALRDETFFQKYIFHIEKILIGKDYKRLITSGFIHVSWLHLIMNLYTLYAFSDVLEYRIGYLNFLIVYFSSLLGGSFLSLYIHRNHGDYSAASASGAISGIIFSAIALYPDINVGLIIFYMPGWLFGFLFVLISIYGIKSRLENIGHDAHLGGALAGLIATVLLYPESLMENYGTIALIGIPSLIFIFIIIKYPSFLIIPSFSFRSSDKNLTFEHRYNSEKIRKQKELDRILDKIHKKGINSLSKKEKEILNSFSEK